MADERSNVDIRNDFAAVANMAAADLERWLETDESQRVGWPKNRGDAESVGHRSGRRIVAIKRKRIADLEPDDYDHMRKVIGYVRRHLAQRPMKDITKTRWRYSLMNWGHDPLKGQSQSFTSDSAVAKRTWRPLLDS